MVIENFVLHALHIHKNVYLRLEKGLAIEILEAEPAPSAVMHGASVRVAR
jgi:hypothetical protein